MTRYFFEIEKQEFVFEVVESGGSFDFENKIPSGLVKYDGYIIVGVFQELPLNLGEFLSTLRNDFVNEKNGCIIGIKPNFVSWEMNYYMEEEHKLRGMKYLIRVNYNSWY